MLRLDSSMSSMLSKSLNYCPGSQMCSSNRNLSPGNLLEMQFLQKLRDISVQLTLQVILMRADTSEAPSS